MRKLLNQLIELKEGLAIAWDAIRANKMRSTLTTLGIVIGIVTVTLMGTAIDGVSRAFHKSISFIGADTLYVDKFNWMMRTEEEWIAASKRRDITLEQIRRLESQMTGVRAIAPVAGTGQAVQYGKRSVSSVQIIGSTDQFLTTSGFSIDQGRFLSESEGEGVRPVCVIGTDVADKLFIHESPLGKRIKVGAKTLEIIGVLAKQGSFLGLESLDNEVIVPLPKFLEGYWRNPSFQIQVKVGDVTKIEESKEELRGLLRKIRHVAPGAPDDFAINQQELFVKLFDSISGVIASVGLVITSLSLFVGGIGIMNIMFVSVAERTREIGVRKAIGAKRRTILAQFLIEAAMICLMGGLLGLAITYPLTLLGNRFLPLHMSLPVAGMAIIVSLLTGVVSGFLPAWRAARMDPVEALRNE
jgi:putative ABC transport system permease protein